jgi:hypothetical protein
MVLPQEVADGGDAARDGAFGEVAEAQDKLRGLGGTVESVGTHAVQPDGASAGDGYDGLFVSVLGQAGDGVEPCGQAAYPGAGGVSAQCMDEDFAAGGVERAHPAQVPVEAAGVEQRGQGQLIQGRAAAVVVALCVGEVLGELWGADDPAEPQPRGQGFADAAEQRDPVRGQTLEGADWLAVVAELGVVVVFDHEGVVAPGPVQQGVPSFGGHDHAGGGLVGGGDDAHAPASPPIIRSTP